MSDQPPPGPQDWTPPQQPSEPPPNSPPPQAPPQAQPPPPPTQQWGPPPGPGGYQQYGAPGYAAPRRTEGNAIAALVLAICSFVVCPLIPAIIALFLASSATRNIQASNGALDGASLVSAAKIVAWINIGLCLVGVAVVILLIILAAVGSSSSSAIGALALG